MASMPAYAIIILAAGNSSRLGEPKQLLQYQDKTLIRHVTEAAIAAKSSAVIVVTGFNASLIETELDFLPCRAIYNPNWESGMASSVVAGVNELLAIHTEVAGVIFAVSDQPFVTTALFEALIERASTDHSGIVASSYDGTLGTPVLFSSKYFSSLLTLSGAEGAKKLLKKFANDTSSVPFHKGSIDIDTQQDYKNLLDNH